jgi:hypothetical protein
MVADITNLIIPTFKQRIMHNFTAETLKGLQLIAEIFCFLAELLMLSTWVAKLENMEPLQQ